MKHEEDPETLASAIRVAALYLSDDDEDDERERES